MSLSRKENPSDLPILAGDEARRIDKEVSEKLGRVRILETVAGRIADAIAYYLVEDESTPLLFVAGKGNNGANAVAAARMLRMRGRDARVLPLADVNNEDRLSPNMREQIGIFRELAGGDRILPLDLSIIESFEGIIVDGILGTGISEPPRGISKDAIRAINKSQKSKVVSIDLPTGLNHITGEAPGECIRAAWTLNLHMLKSGQLESNAKEYIGELWSAESGLGFETFPGLAKSFASFYKLGSIRKV